MVTYSKITRSDEPEEEEDVSDPSDSWKPEDYIPPWKTDEDEE
jgi:hypothetical protein